MTKAKQLINKTLERAISQIRHECCSEASRRIIKRLEERFRYVISAEDAADLW